ncbi:TRAP transporter substrate-binding protein DctP [Arthrobacter sp. B6]|uniref:TRAP transporter substrate-binding protein DctP n=1 Tax=Arthrobacter sp. B6 TaxID=1570137 RepID=UPI000833B463|nr:TRAP transporter substrate-binding protein DctP [Arthrobacter sp. B6]
MLYASTNSSPGIGKRIIAAAVVAASAITLAACTGSGTTNADGPTLKDMEPVTLTYSEAFGEGSLSQKATANFMEAVTERTEGKVTFDVYLSGSLHPVTEGLAAVQSGLTDMTNYIPGYFGDSLPGGQWANALATLQWGGYPQDMLSGTAASQEFTLSTPELSAELEKWNAVPLGSYTGPSLFLLCTKPIETLADAQGVQTRTAGWPFSDDIEALGMTNVFTPDLEIFEALQRGVIDCAVTAPSVAMGAGLWDVATYVHPLPLPNSAGSGYMVSKDVWEAFPEEVRTIFREEATGLAGDYLRGYAEVNARWATESEAHGVTWVDTSELLPTIEKAHQARIENIAGLAPDTIKDPESVIERYKATVDEWDAYLNDDLGYVLNKEPNGKELKQAYLDAAESFSWDDYRERLAAAAVGG